MKIRQLLALLYCWSACISCCRAQFVRTTFALLAAPLELDCSSTSEDNDQMGYVADNTFFWTYHGKFNADSKERVDKYSGKLVFAAVSGGHSGRYDCWVISKERADGRMVAQKHRHRLVVYVLAKRSLSETHRIQMPQCIERLNADLTARYQKSLCEDIAPMETCPYMASFTCNFAPKTGEHTILDAYDHDLIITTNISTSTYYRPPSCNLQCLDEAVTRHLDHLTKTARLILYSTVRDSNNMGLIWFKISHDKETLIITDDCSPGYMLYRDQLCVACDPGSYKNQYSHQCLKCPLNTYQSVGAATDCTRCPRSRSTHMTGAAGPEHCVKAGGATAAHLRLEYILVMVVLVGSLL